MNGRGRQDVRLEGGNLLREGRVGGKWKQRWACKGGICRSVKVFAWMGACGSVNRYVQACSQVCARKREREGIVHSECACAH